MSFFKENLSKLQNENAEHMPVGFEVAFPSLLDIARSLNIEVPDDSPILNDIFAKRNVKLARYKDSFSHNLSFGHNYACQRLRCAHIYFHNKIKATLSYKHILWLCVCVCGPWRGGNRIPREMMHKVPTTLLHSLEGMSGLDWKKLLKQQSEDGSFLFSPSSTAFALMRTKDENCLKYLNKAVNKFNGGGKGPLAHRAHH